jgi:O-antigen/teichoic acid export membrane protein
LTKVNKGIITLADQAVFSATNFLTGVIIGRSCSKEDFGLYMLGFSIILFILTIHNSIIAAPYTIHSAHLKGSLLSRYKGSTLIHQFGISLAAVLFLLVVNFTLSFDYGPEGLNEIIKTLILIITFILLREFIRRVSFAHLHMGVAFALDSVVALFQLGGLLILAYYSLLSPSRAYWMSGAACGAAALIWLLFMQREMIVRFTEVLSDFEKNWSIGKWSLSANIAVILTNQLYFWFITLFKGAADAGILAACQGVIFLANPFLLGTKNILMPKTALAFVNRGPDGLIRLVTGATILISTVMGIFSLSIFAAGDKLAVIIYGTKYSGTGSVISMLALSLLVSAIALGPAHGLMALKRFDLNFKVDIIAFFITLTFGMLLVRSYGLIGVGLSLLVSNTVTTIIRLLIFNRQVRSFQF